MGDNYELMQDNSCSLSKYIYRQLKIERENTFYARSSNTIIYNSRKIKRET